VRWAFAIPLILVALGVDLMHVIDILFTAIALFHVGKVTTASLT
jgi:hypothetical protein